MDAGFRTFQRWPTAGNRLRAARADHAAQRQPEPCCSQIAVPSNMSGPALGASPGRWCCRCWSGAGRRSRSHGRAGSDRWLSQELAGTNPPSTPSYRTSAGTGTVAHSSHRSSRGCKQLGNVETFSSGGASISSEIRGPARLHAVLVAGMRSSSIGLLSLQAEPRNPTPTQNVDRSTGPPEGSVAPCITTRPILRERPGESPTPPRDAGSPSKRSVAVRSAALLS